jgi:hypothetical protein
MSALQFKSALIAFHHLNGRHTGELLATTLISLLDRAGVTAKVSMTAYHSCYGHVNRMPDLGN